MQSKANMMIKKRAELRNKVQDRLTKGPEFLKQKDKEKLSKIRNNIKRNSKK